MTHPASTLLDEASWPASKLGEAVRALLYKAGFAAEGVDGDSPALPLESDGDVDGWMTDTAARFGLEIISVSSTCGELPDMLRRLGPSVLRLPGPRPERYLVVLNGGSFRLTVLTPDNEVRRIAPSLVHERLISEQLTAEQASVSALMSDLELVDTLGDQGLRAFALDRLNEAPFAGIWLVRAAPAGAARDHIRSTHLPLLLALVLIARALSTGLTMMVWWLIGRAVLESKGSGALLALWATCLVSIVPLRLLEAWAQSRLSVDVGALVKRSTLYGILHLDRADTRGLGVGRFLGMVMDSEASSTAVSSALLVLTSLVEIVGALVVLCVSAGGGAHALLLAAWIAFTAWLAWRYAAQARRWNAVLRKITHDLVERLVGYQTRLVQEDPKDWHKEEGLLLDEYASASQKLNRRKLFIEGTVATGWLILGIGALEPAFLSGAQGGALAAAVGGVVLAGGALKQLVSSVDQLVEQWVAWQQSMPILQAGLRALERDVALRRASSSRAPTRETRSATPAPETRSGELPLVWFKDVSLRYKSQAPAALHQCSEQIHAGDRILLEGPSGGGKSTLAIVLASLRAPDAGAIWLRGENSEDVPADAWRARIVLAPQFHDNHILTESLLFNLLLGRRWPPTPADIELAAAICSRLGLSPLLQRMPQGLAQMVGDSGWTLSHGERSRVFLARSLLQERAMLIILDESFAALDPESLRLACRGVVELAPTLLVIAHP